MISILGAKLRGLLRDCRAVATLELALILPVILVLFFGTVEVTQMIRASNKLNMAAQSIENIIAGQKTVAATDVANAVQGGQLMMTPFSATLAVQVVSVNFNAAGAASSVGWQVVTGGAKALTPAAACAAVATLGLGSDSVILVQASYAYSAVVHYVLPANVTLSHTAFGRPRTVNAAGPSTPTLAGNC